MQRLTRAYSRASENAFSQATQLFFLSKKASQRMMSLSMFEPCFVDRKGNQLLSDSHCDLTEKEMSRQNDKIK